MKHNEEGFNRSAGGMSAVDALLTSNKFEPSLRSSVIHSTPITETNRRLLVYVKDHPGCTEKRCASSLGLSSVLNKFSNFVQIGYLKMSGNSLKTGKFFIDTNGEEAIKRTQINHHLRNEVIRSNVSDYEVYVPPRSDQEGLRRGSMDAFKLPSLSR